MTVLTVCFAMNFAARGLVESFVVFVLPLSQSFGWDRAAVVSIQSFAMLATGIFAPIAGRIFDRSGPRMVYGLGLGLIGAGMSLAPFAHALWQFQLCLGLAVGTGAACLGNAPNSALVSRWFRPRLTIAMSILWSAAGIGVLVLVPLAQLLVGDFGWRTAYQCLGGLTLLAFAPALLLPWQRYAAGDPRDTRVAPGAPATNRPDEADEGGWTLPRAMRHSAFWGLFCVFLFTSFGVSGTVVQVVAYLVEIGFPPLEAATAWGISGLLLPLGMIGFGWLDGQIGRRPSIFLSYALSLSGIALLWLLGRYPNVWILGAAILLFGGTAGSRGPLISTIAMRLFHGRRVGTIFGTISIGAGLGAALGSWFGGLLHDWSGYDLVFACAFLSVLCGQLPFWIVPALRQ
jgi:MFS family permease